MPPDSGWNVSSWITPLEGRRVRDMEHLCGIVFTRIMLKLNVHREKKVKTHLRQDKASPDQPGLAIFVIKDELKSAQCSLSFTVLRSFLLSRPFGKRQAHICRCGFLLRSMAGLTNVRTEQQIQVGGRGWSGHSHCSKDGCSATWDSIYPYSSPSWICIPERTNLMCPPEHRRNIFGDNWGQPVYFIG